MSKFEPCWKVRVAVSLPGLAAALPSVREKVEVAAELAAFAEPQAATPMLQADVWRPPLSDLVSLS